MNYGIGIRLKVALLVAAHPKTETAAASHNGTGVKLEDFDGVGGRLQGWFPATAVVRAESTTEDLTGNGTLGGGRT